MKKCFLTYVFVLACTAIMWSCGSETQTYVPKPKGFNRIDLPRPAYRKLSESHPYVFEYSQYAKAVPDTFPMAEKDWIFINYPSLKANIQLTYKSLGNDPKRLKAFIDDSFKLTTKHQIRASSIQEQRIVTASGRTAMLFRIEGDVPSPYQFYTTDSSNHFLRGAIYFPVATKNDSLAPVIDYLRQDMVHLLNTLQWR